MIVTVISLGAVGLVWYSLSWLSALSNVFQTDWQEWLLYTLGISNWVSCVGPSCVRIGNKLGGYPSCSGSVVCCNKRRQTALPLQRYPLCVKHTVAVPVRCLLRRVRLVLFGENQTLFVSHLF